MPGTALRGEDRAMNTIYVTRASAPQRLIPKSSTSVGKH